MLIFIAAENFLCKVWSESMPLLFFDVPNLWSPIIPPFRFKIIGFFVALTLIDG